MLTSLRCAKIIAHAIRVYFLNRFNKEVQHAYVFFHQELQVPYRRTLLIMLFSFFCWGWPSQKRLRLRRFKSDLDEIWQDCSSLTCKYIHFDWRVVLLIWRHSFKTATTTSLHREKCCHLVRAHATFARRPLHLLSCYRSIVHLHLIMLPHRLIFLHQNWSHTAMRPLAYAAASAGCPLGCSSWSIVLVLLYCVL